MNNSFYNYMPVTMWLCHLLRLEWPSDLLWVMECSRNAAMGLSSLCHERPWRFLPSGTLRSPWVKVCVACRRIEPHEFRSDLIFPAEASDVTLYQIMCDRAQPRLAKPPSQPTTEHRPVVSPVKEAERAQCSRTTHLTCILDLFSAVKILGGLLHSSN